jgi:hypothetical protein
VRRASPGGIRLRPPKRAGIRLGRHQSSQFAFRGALGCLEPRVLVSDTAGAIAADETSNSQTPRVRCRMLPGLVSLELLG